MATDYIILSSTGAIGGGKRVRIYAATYRASSGGDIQTEITLNAKRYGPIDVDLPTYTLDVLVRHTESDSNYFSLSTLRAVRFGSTAATRKLKYQDPFGAVHDVLWTSAWSPAPALANNLDGSDGWYTMTIRLEEYQ
jgi:hypothetical protein